MGQIGSPLALKGLSIAAEVTHRFQTEPAICGRWSRPRVEMTVRESWDVSGVRGGWRPRHVSDAVYPSAVARQELENHHRPVWLPDDLPLPSARVWNLLQEGDRQMPRYAVFQSVVTGLVNAGWPEVCIAHALKDNAQHPAAPGYWWIKKRGGRSSEFDRALVKARQRVGENQPDARLAKHSSGAAATAVTQFLDQLEQQLLNTSAPGATSLFPAHLNRPFTRSVVWALAQHAREHASLLEVSDEDGSLCVAASARCLASKVNASHQAISDVLQALCAGSQPGEPAHTPLLRLASTGRPDDAHTYRIEPSRHDRNSTLPAPATEPSLPQPSGETYGKHSAATPSLKPPVQAVLAHDAFLHGDTTDLGLTRTQGFMMALIAANPEMLRTLELAQLTGLGARSVRASLRPLLTHQPEGRAPLLTRQCDRSYALAADSPEQLLHDLDDLARRSGAAGTNERRRATFDKERAARAARHH